ncbi:IclR family transcriptional regulator [Microvirga sp. 2YAF29]|uniref:IclR family transcriptional regulator n=1 Tax=Microvirga sp. 2YAF29 TaxID=3233031 RepID=UPI003F9B1A7F
MRKLQVRRLAPTIIAPDDDPRFVIALARGLSVLRAFRRGEPGLGNQHIADRTSLPKSTISRLTYTLSRLGYLEYSPLTGLYSPSAAALALGFSALGGLSIRDVARPMMQTLADRIGCSVSIGVPDRGTMVYIEHCRGPGLLHIGIEIGAHIDMAMSAIGRAYLAGLDPATRDNVLDEICPPEPRGDAVRLGIQRSMEQFSAQGYVTMAGEWKEEIHSVGVPLTLRGSQPYAVNCVGPAHLLRGDFLEDVGCNLVDLTARIRRAMSSD